MNPEVIGSDTLGMKVGTLLIILLLPTFASADYVATGPIKADDCWGIGIKICDIVEVKAFKKDGQFYEMPTRFRTVTEYSSNDRCSIRLSSDIWTPSQWAPDQLKVTPTFYKVKDGKLKEITPSYLSFSCREMK